MHKLNHTIQSVTFVAENRLTLADLALFSVLKDHVKQWEFDERVNLVNICRWYDNIQHLEILKNNFPNESLVIFVLDFKKEKPQKIVKNDESNFGNQDKKETKETKKEMKESTNETKETKSVESKTIVNSSLLDRVDFRIGRIVECVKHPEADSLYVEKIDLDEPQPRVIVSGLVKFIPLEKMINRLVVVVANLKPAKLKNIMSAGMVLAASNDDHSKVELVEPPLNSKVGERITFDGHTGEPDEQLNPKKKIFENIKPALRTNSDCIAMFENIPFMTSAGPCTVETLKEATLG